MGHKTRTLYTTSKRVGYVLACAPDENIKFVRFDQSQVGAYSLVGESGGRTATVFATKRQAQRAKNLVSENRNTVGWFAIIAVGMQESSRIRKRL